MDPEQGMSPWGAGPLAWATLLSILAGRDLGPGEEGGSPLGGLWGLVPRTSLAFPCGLPEIDGDRRAAQRRGRPRQRSEVSGHWGGGLTRRSSALRTAATSRPPARPRTGAPGAAATSSPATATPRGPRHCHPRSWSAQPQGPGRSLRGAEGQWVQRDGTSSMQPTRSHPSRSCA